MFLFHFSEAATKRCSNICRRKPWKIPVKKFVFSKVANLPSATLLRMYFVTGIFYGFWLQTLREQLLLRTSLFPRTTPAAVSDSFFLWTFLPGEFWMKGWICSCAAATTLKNDFRTAKTWTKTSNNRASTNKKRWKTNLS